MTWITEWERSKDFARPWRLDPREYETRYGRTSAAIVDANDKVILLLDPSDDEYEPACTKEAAEEIVRLGK